MVTTNELRMLLDQILQATLLKVLKLIFLEVESDLSTPAKNLTSVIYTDVEMLQNNDGFTIMCVVDLMYMTTVVDCTLTLSSHITKTVVG